jgi:hypothetical protein
MKRTVNTLPDPTPESVVLWLSQLDRAKVHDAGWQEVNKRFHAIARAVRPFVRKQYPDAADQEAFFDGLTLALMTMGHFADVGQLAERLGTIKASEVAHSAKKDAPRTGPSVK